MCLIFEFSQSKPLLQIDTPLHPSRVKSFTRSDVMEYKSELHTWNHNLPKISINWHKRSEKKSSLTKVWQVRLLAKPVLKTDIQICQTVYCILWHAGCLHLSNTPLTARWKTEPLKLHSGLWCRVCVHLMDTFRWATWGILFWQMKYM